jgi:hypothetical protein
MSDTTAAEKTATEAPKPKRFEPPISEEAAPFWEGTRERKLLLPWCTACPQPIWFPRAICPRCSGSDIEWREASGRGFVYALTVEHTAQTRALAAPYVVALVELDEGVRFLSNVVGCPPEEVAVGTAVQVTWELLSDGRHLPLFTPTGQRPQQDVLVGVRPALRRAGHEHPGRRLDGHARTGPGRLRAGSVAAKLPLDT